MNVTKRETHEAQAYNRLEVTPLSRVSESDEAFTLTVELPGVGEKEVEVTLEDRTLTVAAENTLGVHKDHKLVLTEIPEVRYRVAFELPERVDPAKIKATTKNGLLILTLPKREEVKPRRISVGAA